MGLRGDMTTRGRFEGRSCPRRGYSILRAHLVAAAQMQRLRASVEDVPKGLFHQGARSLSKELELSCEPAKWVL